MCRLPRIFSVSNMYPQNSKNKLHSCPFFFVWVCGYVSHHVSLLIFTTSIVSPYSLCCVTINVCFFSCVKILCLHKKKKPAAKRWSASVLRDRGMDIRYPNDIAHLWFFNKSVSNCTTDIPAKTSIRCRIFQTLPSSWRYLLSYRVIHHPTPIVSRGFLFVRVFFRRFYVKTPYKYTRREQGFFFFQKSTFWKKHTKKSLGKYCP